MAARTRKHRLARAPALRRDSSSIALTRCARTWWLYLVRRRDRALYTGITLDVERRVREHAIGKGAKALRGRGPVALVFAAAIGDRADAQRVEARVKRLAKADKERLVASRAFARRWLARAQGTPLSGSGSYLRASKVPRRPSMKGAARVHCWARPSQ